MLDLATELVILTFETGFQEKVQLALHASQRQRQRSEEGIWCAGSPQ
jgi:hypothetical protein